MIVYRWVTRQLAQLIMVSILVYPVISGAESKKKIELNGSATLKGIVIATPCSVVMQNRFQTIDFSPLAITMLGTKLQREQHNQPFILELRDCGSLYSSLDVKTWSIRFMGQTAEHINGFVLQGASRGLGVSVLDNRLNALVPGQYYSLSDNVLLHDKSEKTLFLQYFLRLELTGEPIQAGNYQGLIRFFIDYQ
ncbi:MULTISPECIES: fimbrial protein [Providencia]|uniref:Fimbrial protein n=1 Tax=Providencia alcalifaciens 205/92 TaxID=1256988 RepID=A0AAV3MAL4_9GAMM|nr:MULTISPECIES: fimbrial protein [Providencia]EKT62816.1 fimbrial subunit [Providencia alcalifaciens Dmel2]ETT06758.1 fimbrial protein [Providencia alcalifaciens F90-2004]EUC95428.1 fimbrial protein [Providencia alcalifaciens PAL-2]EUD05214.1 fimbrial protein [Providencia alcalifaciens RIMD 1656011]EUD05701.1 fimbrial protein [Providencia alcalifaciens R90-1475]